MPQIEPLTESPPFPVNSPGPAESDPVASPEIVTLDSRLDAVESRSLPEGGGDAQILAKASAADFDTEWIDAPTGGGADPRTIVAGNLTATYALDQDGAVEVALEGTLNANCALTWSGWPAGYSHAALSLKQDATGSRTLSINGTSVTIPTAANAGVDVDLTTFDGGATIHVAVPGATGATGATGAAGPQGPAGPAGASGPQIDTLWTAGVAESMRRTSAHLTAGSPLASGRLHLIGGLVLPAGVPCNTITLVASSQGAVTPTHQWFCLIDKATRAILRSTSDDLATAWAAFTAKTLALSSAYTPGAAKAVWVGVMVTAGTVPNFYGVLSSTVLTGLAPVINGSSDTGLTTPLADAAVVTAPSAQAFVPYCSVG